MNTYILRLVFFALLVTGVSPGAPASAESADPLGRDTPQSAVYSFLEACHSHDYIRASKYLELRKLPEDQRVKDGPRLAQQLETILDRDAQFDVAALSRNPAGDLRDGVNPNLELIDSFKVKGQDLRLELERVTLHSGTSVWLFSGDTV